MVPTIFIVDDDPAGRGELQAMLEAAGMQVSSYQSAEDFLAVSGPHQRGCLLLDVRLPRMSGPDLQEALRESGIYLPVIFLTAHGDVATSVRALHGGAFDFLEKPIEGKLLLERIRRALEVDARNRASDEQRQERAARLARLTARERAVMNLVLNAHSNKEIARHLGISHRTVEVYRRRVMQKLQVSSLVQLVIFAEECGGEIWRLPLPRISSTARAQQPEERYT
jgi:FixJ family two-component response regulator